MAISPAYSAGHGGPLLPGGTLAAHHRAAHEAAEVCAHNALNGLAPQLLVLGAGEAVLPKVVVLAIAPGVLH